MMTRRPLLAGLAVTLAGASRAHADAGALTGQWTGVLDAGAQQLRLRLVIGADGTAKLFSIDQGNSEIPARAMSLDPQRIVIDVPPVRGKFEGRLVGTDRLEGTWSQSAALPLVFLRGDAGLSVTPTPATPLTAEQLRVLRTEAGSPALAAAAVKRGGAARFWVDGERAAGSGITATTNDLWHIGSITKSFTATLVARLVDVGAVRWDDAVGDVLGETAPAMRDAYRPVTFRHLLSHRSGLPGNIPMADFARFGRDTVDARDERKAFVRIALAMAPKGPAGPTFEYANNGFVTAGAMLEAKLGQRWEDLMRAHVFAPLGLSTAGFGAPGVAGRTDQPVGHAKAPFAEQRIPYRVGAGITDNPVVLGPAGTIHLSQADMLTYLAAHRDATDFLEPESWRTLHTPPFGGEYAMGWIVRDDGSLWHNGSNTLWYAEASFDSASGVAATAASNDGFLPKSGVAVRKALANAAAAV